MHKSVPAARSPLSPAPFVGLDILAASPPSSGVRAAASVSEEGRPAFAFLIDVLLHAESSHPSLASSEVHTTELVAFETASAERIGEILFSRGELCLVATSRGSMSLGARLSRQHPETATLVRRAVVAARAEGRPISDVLRDIGGADSERIRDALLEQIVEGLCEISRVAPTGVVEQSLSVSTRHLSSVLAGFSPAAVYSRAIPEIVPIVDDAASRCHNELAPSARMAILCARTEAGPLPVAHKGVPCESVRALLAMARSLEQIASPPALLAADVEPSLMHFGRAQDAVIIVSTGAQIAMLGDFDRAARQSALGVAHRIVATTP